MSSLKTGQNESIHDEKYKRSPIEKEKYTNSKSLIDSVTRYYICCNLISKY
jgi:hypothetical protein